MYCLSILIINLNPSSCLQIKSILLRNLMVSYDVQTLQLLPSELEHTTLPKCEVIIAQRIHRDDPIVPWLMEEEPAEMRPKLIIVDREMDYDFVRIALRYGLLDYWLLPLSNQHILETLGSSHFFDESPCYSGLDYQLATMLMGKQPLDEQRLKEFYLAMRGYRESLSEAESEIIRAWRLILKHISFEPMGIHRSTIASMIGRWMVAQPDTFDTFLRAFHYAAKVYNDIFQPHIRSSIARQTIYEVLDPGYRDKSVRHLAKQLYLNQSYLSVTFKNEVGIPLSTYIRRVKLYGSMILILDHQSSLDHVLNILEYRDSKYFAKLFKKHTGLTPDRFRNLYRSIYLHKETRSFEFDRVN